MRDRRTRRNRDLAAREPSAKDAIGSSLIKDRCVDGARSRARPEKNRRNTRCIPKDFRGREPLSHQGGDEWNAMNRGRGSVHMPIVAGECLFSTTSRTRGMSCDARYRALARMRLARGAPHGSGSTLALGAGASMLRTRDAIEPACDLRTIRGPSRRRRAAFARFTSRAHDAGMVRRRACEHVRVLLRN
jgi:hypothetical protein